MSFPLALDLSFLDLINFDDNSTDCEIAEMLRILLMPWLYY